MTVERIHLKAPVMLIFIAIFTCLPSCINLSNIDNRFKLIFTCKSEPSDIYKYIFHIFIKCDYNELNLKFIINNKDFTYNIYVNKFHYSKIEEKLFSMKFKTLKYI